MYLRSTMGQSCLSAVMILHVHKEKTDKISTVDIANEFVQSGGSDHRKTVSGKFSSSDLQQAHAVAFVYCCAHRR